jgi:dihydroneopterin aldolase
LIASGQLFAHHGRERWERERGERAVVDVRLRREEHVNVRALLEG